MAREPLVIGPFSGGLNTYDDPTAVKDTELVECLNWDPGLEGSLKSRPPFTDREAPLTLGSSGNAHFLGFFYSTGNVYHLIVSDGLTSTWAFNGSTWTLITDTFAAAAMAQFDNKAWLVSPVGEADPGGYWTPTDGFTADEDMPHGDSIVSFKSRLWLTPGRGNPNGTRVYYSKVLGQPDFWDAPAFVDVGQGDGQDIVLLTTWYNTLVAFRTQSIYAFSFNADPAQGAVTLLVPNIGLTSKDCLVSYEGYMYFMYDDKAYQFINNNAQQINMKVPFTATSRANISLPYAVSLFNNRAIFHYFDTMYVFSLRTKTWTKWRSPQYGAIGQIMSPSGVLTDEAFVNPSRSVPLDVTSLIYEDGFEVGISDWAAGSGSQQGWSTTAPRTGVHALGLSRSLGPGEHTTSRTITGLTIGKSYVAEVWVRRTQNPVTDVTISVVDRGESDPVTLSDDEYVQVVCSFTANATSHVLKLSGTSDSAGPAHGTYWDDLSVREANNRQSPLLYISDEFTNETENYVCEIQTKNYNYQLSSNFKRLFWWGVDAVFRTRIRGWAVPVVHSSQTTWGTLREQGVTWGQLLGGTWGSPFLGDVSVLTDLDLEGAGPVRKFVKMFKSMRFRQIYFRVLFDTDGSIGSAPVHLFTITAYVGAKETVSKAVS